MPEGLHRPRILTAPLARPAMPLLYSSSSLPETHLPKAMIRPSNGCTNKCIDMSGPRRSSESRSPTSASSERSDRVREKERGAEKERMRSSSSTRSVDLEFGEDLVNMVDTFTVAINLFHFRMRLQHPTNEYGNFYSLVFSQS